MPITVPHMEIDCTSIPFDCIIKLQKGGMAMEADRRAEVWAKTGGRCWYCGTQTAPWKNFHVEHSVPKSKGGTDAIENLVPSCSTCNARKHDRDIEEFRVYLQTKAAHKFWFEHALQPPPPVEDLDADEEAEDKEDEQGWIINPSRETYEHFLELCMYGTSVHPCMALTLIGFLHVAEEFKSRDGIDTIRGNFGFDDLQVRARLSLIEMLPHIGFLLEKNFLAIVTFPEHWKWFSLRLGEFVDTYVLQEG